MDNEPVVITTAITAGAAIAAAYLNAKSKRDEKNSDGDAQVQIARIAAGQENNKSFYEAWQQSEKRHEADQERLEACNDARRNAETRVLILQAENALLLKRLGEYAHSRRKNPILLIDAAAHYRCDAQGFCIEASALLCEMFGLASGEMLGTGWTSVIINPSMRMEAWATWSSAVANGSVSDYYDAYQIKNAATGEIINLETTATALRDERGELTGYAGICKRLN